MKTDSATILRRDSRERGFTIIELMVCLFIIGIVVVAIYGAISSGVGSLRMARENLRATQILIEKMEGVRLYTWEQLNAPGFVPTTFIVPYDALSTNTNSGVRYFGSITITNYPHNTTYGVEMRQVKVTLNWRTAGLERTRELITYVAQSGIQNYIY